MKDSNSPDNISQSKESKSFYLDSNAKNVQVMLDAGLLEKDPSGKKNHYQFTPKYEEKLQATISEVAPKVGMAREDLTKLIHLAIANDTYSTYRPPNLETKNRVEEGAIGKPMLTKGKSSEGGKGANGTWDPTKGLIPKDQSMSKLAPDEVAAFQKKVDDSIKIGDSQAFDLKQTEKDGTKIAWHVVNHPGGAKDFVYKKENTEEYFYKNENKEEKPYGKPFVPPVPVQVLGEKVNGKESYYTADYDPLFSATQIPKTVQEKTEFFKPLKEDHFQELLGKDTELGKAAPNVVRNLGVISATEAALVTDVEILTKNRARHGNDVSNPYSTPKTLADDLKQGIIAFKPNGDISLIKSEEKLIKTINEARKEGYGVIPNPQWGWKQDDSNKQFYVPPERVNWEKDAKLVEEWQKKAETNKENPEYKEKASQGKEIYNLKIELEKHQYRETLIGNYGKEGDTLDPGYITSATAPLAKQKLQDLEKLYNKNIDSNKIENISAAKENVPLEAEIKQVNIPVAAPIQPRILENKPATQEIKKNTIASDASEKSENISTVKENVPASSVKKGEKNNPAPAGPNSVTDGPVAAPVQQVTLENKQATQKIQPNATAIDTSKNTENKTMTPKDVALDALNKEKLTVSKPVNSQNSAAQKDFSGKGEVRNLSTEKAKPRTISPDGQAVNEDIRKFDKALLKQVLKGFKEKDALKTVKVNSSSTGSPNPSLPTGSKSRQQNRKPQRG